MEYVPPNFKLNFLQCPQPLRNNTCLAFIHFLLHLTVLPTQHSCFLHTPSENLYPYQGEFPYYRSVPESVHTPGTNRDSRSCWLLCQHQGQKNAKQEQRILSRRKWAPSSGRPHLTFGTIIEYGNMIEKQNWSVCCCHGNDWSCISLGPTPPPHFLNSGIFYTVLY